MFCFCCIVSFIVMVQVSTESCEPINFEFCMDVGYAFTRIPNSFGFENQNRSAFEVQRSYKSLKEDGCKGDLKTFLCKVYFPKCDPDRNSTDFVGPFRHECENALEGCKGRYFDPDNMCYNYPEGVSECQSVEVTACRDLGYKTTKSQNSLGMVDQIYISSVFNVMELGCTGSYAEFLCQLYFPPCDSDNLKPPSNDLCQKTKKACEPVINQFGMVIDMYFDCDTYPENTTKKAWYTDFIHPGDTNEIHLNIKYSPTAIIFYSCCQLYSSVAKEFALPIYTEVQVSTADIRSSSVPTVFFNGFSSEQNKSSYNTLVMVTGYDPTPGNETNTFNIYTNWMLVNIREGDVSTGITVKEYEGPHPTANTDNKVFFLIYRHFKMVNVAELGKYNTPPYSRFQMDMASFVKDNKMVLIASKKIFVNVDEYSRYRSKTEKGEQESEICSDVLNYPKSCSVDPKHIIQTIVRK